MNLEGKTYIVTGSSMGIGEAIAAGVRKGLKKDKDEWDAFGEDEDEDDIADRWKGARGAQAYDAPHGADVPKFA